MDDTWHIKCSSTWTLPSPSLPPASSPVPAFQPPPPMVGSQVLGSGSVNQMDMNPRPFFHPIVAHEGGLGDHGLAQEPLVFSTLNLGSLKPGQIELGSSFLALLSGHSQHLPGESSLSSNPRSAVAKLPIHDGDTVLSSAGCGVPISVIAPLSESHGNGAMGSEDISSFIASRQLSMPACSRAPVMHNNLPLVGYHCHGSDSAKLVPHQAFHSNESRMAVSTLRHVSPTVHSPTSNSLQHTLNIQTSQKMSLGKSEVSGHAPPFLRGGPRVFCMGTVGELFVSEIGLLGVRCSCHSLRMSVAKFCEHSGSPSVNPGDAVHMENGMTVAQWCKLSFGIGAHDDGNGWNRPDGSLAPGCLSGSKANKFPALSKNPGMFQSFGAFSGLERPVEPGNNFIYANHQNTGVAAQTALENSVNMVAINADQRNTLEGRNPPLKSFSGTVKCVMPTLAYNNRVQAGKETLCMGMSSSNSALFKGEQSIEPQSVADNVSFIGKGGNQSISYPSSGTVKSFNRVPSISSGNFSSEAFVMDRDSVSSNIELRLGQPSQHNHTVLGAIPAAMCPPQIQAMYDSQKPQSHQPLTHKTVYHREEDEPRPKIRCTSNRRQLQHALGNAKVTDPYVPEEFKGDTTKSSIISFFLSHLNNNGENNPSQSTGCLVNKGDHFIPMVLDGDSLSSKCNLSDFSRNVTNGTERKSDINGSDLSNHINKGKGRTAIADNGSYNAAKPNSLFHNKQIADSRIYSSGIGGHCLDRSSAVDNRQSLLYLHQPSSMLMNESDARNSTQLRQSSFLRSKDHSDHVILRPTNSVSYATARPGALSSASPVSLSSTNSIYIPESTAFSNEKDINHHLLDEKSRFIAFKHMAELSKQEKSSVSLKMSSQHGRSCCLSAMEVQENVCRDDLVASEKFRQGPYCSIQHDASKVAVTSGYSCSNCYFSGGNENLAGMPAILRPDNCCNCRSSTQRISLCSKEHDIQFLTCHVCGANEQPLLRLGRIENNNATTSFEHEVRSEEQNTYLPGNYSCTTLSKGSRGCCICRGESRFDALKDHSVCGTTKIHVPVYNKDRMLQDGQKVRLGRCEGLKNHNVMKNGCHTPLWRDVPRKVREHSDATINEKPVHVLESTGIVGDQLAVTRFTTANEFDGNQKESKAMKEQHLSNACSGCTVPTVTELTVNNVGSCIAGVADANSMQDLMVDEGSGIEKCGSSDEALNSRKWEDAPTFTSKVDSVTELYCLPSHSSSALINDLKIGNSSKLKRLRNQVKVRCRTQESINQKQQFKRVLKVEKGNRGVKKRPNASIPESGLSSIHSGSPDCTGHSKLNLPPSKMIELPLQHDNRMQTKCVYSCRTSNVNKRKRSSLISTKSLSWKKLENHHKVWDDVNQMQSSHDDHSFRMPKLLVGKKVQQNLTANGKKQFEKQDEIFGDAEKSPKYMSLVSIKNSSSHAMDTRDRKVRPVVCGNLGIITNGLCGQQKPAKIVSLSAVIKSSKRCSITKNEGEPRLCSIAGDKIACRSANNRHCTALSTWKKKRDYEDSSFVLQNGRELSILHMSGTSKGCSSTNEGCLDKLAIPKRESNRGNIRTAKLGNHHGFVKAQAKSTYKETRKRSLSELTVKGKYAIKRPCLANLGENEFANLIEAGPQLKMPPFVDLVNKFQDSEDHAGETCQRNTRRSSTMSKCQPLLLDSDAFCCVCGSSIKDEANHLLECNHCLIRVHQACYGVSKVPKGHWCCRPCKTNSKNIACVLCGYEGGAMTRALRSRNIVKRLLNAWKVRTGFKPMKSISLSETLREASECEESGSVPVMRSTNSDALPGASLKMCLQNRTNIKEHSDSLPINFEAYNTIIAGEFDPSVIQWVHMVCGLWTPGTRCPNVDTMSAFDVSGASPARKNIVCSMCNRPGGSCIQCRVLNCSVHFHPWCAHQKGLLQSEIEGIDNENVGFYGRCVLHATHHSLYIDSRPVDTEVESPTNKDFTCARMEGYKGRKQEKGFKSNFHEPSRDSNGCIVPQEQIDAWLHINGQKLCTRGPVKPPSSDIEYDVRKEYVRYKQAKGWKHLVVYKSGIHALGLYTSQFIARGAMVVEYVGEIVGLRVADKREIEYQSGRKLQYKSACYFFRIDKEHIIDATRKGGIARFVNHSCLPNCVAKVISVRNEKKVVFFAERDINPGEEITYDYHFNHEDEGKKIPCFCKSRNCRRYLN